MDNKANFKLKTGDRVGIDSIMIQAGQSNSNQTIEFSGENVAGKPYCDNKVVFEFGFYINNNSQYNLTLPVRAAHAWQQWQGALTPTAETTTHGLLQILPVNSGIYPPQPWSTPGAGGWGDGMGSIITQGEPSFEFAVPGKGFNHTEEGAYSVGPNECYGNNWTAEAAAARAAAGLPVLANDAAGVHWYDTLSTATFVTANSAYQKLKYIIVSNTNTFNAAPPVPNIPNDNMPANGIADFHYCKQPISNKKVNGTTIISPITNGNYMMPYNFPITAGMGICIADSFAEFENNATGWVWTPPNARSVLGIVKRIWAQDDPDWTQQFGPQAPIDDAGNQRLIIELRDDYTPQDGLDASGVWPASTADLFPNPVVGYGQAGGTTLNGTGQANIIGFTATGGWSSNSFAPYGAGASSIQAAAQEQIAFPPVPAGYNPNYYTRKAQIDMWDRKSKCNIAVGNFNASIKCSLAVEAGKLSCAMNELYSLNPVNRGGGLSTGQAGGIRALGGGALWDFYRARCSGPPDIILKISEDIFGSPTTAPFNLFPAILNPQDQGTQCAINRYKADGGGFVGAALPDAGPEEIKTIDFTNYNNNKPYIMVCPSYQGCNSYPNGSGGATNSTTPLLKPMTCFIVCEATEKFEDVSKLAEKITKAFHSVNPFLNKEAGNDVQKILSQQTPERQITNNVVPYYSNGQFSIMCTGFPTTTGDPNYTYQDASLYTGIAPLYCGNMIKCLPANLQISHDFTKQRAGPYYVTPDVNSGSHSSGGGDVFTPASRGTYKNCNLIYGNCGFQNFNEAEQGDRVLKEAHVWSLNTLASTDIWTDPVVNELAASGSYKWHFDCGRPVLLNCRMGSSFPTAPNCFTSNIAITPGQDDMFHTPLIMKYMGLMTNMYWDDDNIKLFTETMRKLEVYDVDAIDAVNGEEAQNAPSQNKNWYIDYMIGESDDSKIAQDNQGVMQSALPLPFGIGGPPYYQHRVITPNWQGDPNAGWGFDVNAAGFKQAAPENAYVGLGADPMVFNEYRRATTPYDQQFYGTWTGNSVDSGKVASWVSPAQNSVGNGMERSYKAAKRTGIIRVHSRWFPEMDTDTNIPNFKYEETPQKGTGALAGGSQADGSTGNACKTHHNQGANDWIFDPQQARDANIAIYPYNYYVRNGTTKKFIGFLSYKHYEGLVGQRDTWELQNFNWGSFFIWSPSAYDNGGILIPMNGDAVKSIKTNAVLDPQKDITPLKSNNWNNMNYVYVGAGDAEMIFDDTLNRFKLQHLYTETLLSHKNQGTADSTQLGEQEVVYNKDQPTSVFKAYVEVDQEPWVYNKGVIGGSVAQAYEAQNQGVEDAQSGVFLRNIWLPGETWQPPAGVNLQNYFSPKLEYEPDDTINMGGARLTSNSYVDLSGSKAVDVTARNYAAIIENLTEASKEMWDGCLLSRMGFAWRDLIPYAGNQSNRYSEFTYGSDQIHLQNNGTKPLIQNTQSDTSAMISLNMDGSTTGTPSDEGLPLYGLGFINNEPAQVGNLPIGSLSATSIPLLISCPFYIVMSSICDTQFQKGDLPQNTIAVGQKQYSQGEFFYIQANDYTQLIDMDRTLTEISQEIRNPLTGRLARLGKSSCVIYKIERDIFVPLPDVDVDGEPINEPKMNKGGQENRMEVAKQLGGAADPLSDPLTNEERAEIEPVLEAGSNYGWLSITPAHLREQQQQTMRAQQYVDTLSQRYAMEQGQRGREIDNNLLTEGIMRLAVKKALNNLAVLARKNELLNPSIIATSLKEVYNKLLKEVPQIIQGEEVDPKKIMEALRTKDIYLGADGQVIERREKYAGQQSGRYAVTDEVGDNIASQVSGSYDNLLAVVRQAVAEKQIKFNYSPTGADRTPHFTTTDEMYQVAEGMDSGVFLPELAEGAGDFGNQERMEARAAARRELTKKYGENIPKEEELNELRLADSNPVRYLQEHAAKGGREEKGGEPITERERIRKHDEMIERANREAERGKLIKDARAKGDTKRVKYLQQTATGDANDARTGAPGVSDRDIMLRQARINEEAAARYKARQDLAERAKKKPKSARKK